MRLNITIQQKVLDWSRNNVTEAVIRHAEKPVDWSSVEENYLGSRSDGGCFISNIFIGTFIMHITLLRIREFILHNCTTQYYPNAGNKMIV